MSKNPLKRAGVFIHIKEKYTNRVTPAGTFFILFFFVSIIFGLNPEKSMLYQISTFSLGLLLIAYLFTFKFKTNLKIKRDLPDLCVINKKTTYRLLVENKNQKNISGLSFKDVTDPLLMTSLIQNIPEINIENIIEIDAVFTPEKRGYIHIEGVYFFNEDPFGLLRKRFFIKAPANILVVPKMYNIPLFKLSGKRKYNQGGIPFAEKKGESEDFISLKKYIPGDSIKKINWKASAKTGEIIVNEYQDEYFSRYGLVLDTFSKSDNMAFEEAVSIAASILTSTDLGESILDLMFLGIKSYKITIGNGINSQKRALEVLASASTCQNNGFDNLITLINNSIPLLNSIILLLIDIDASRVKLIDLLSRHNIELKVILISDNPEKSKKKIKELGIKTSIAVLKTGEIETSINEVIL